MLFFLSKKKLQAWAIKYAFESQSKPKGFQGLTVAFIDSQGMRYYKYVDDMHMHINRLAQLKRIYGELSCKIDGTELSQFINKMRDELNNAVNAPTKRNSVTNIAGIGRCIEEMADRERILIHEELHYSLAAIYLIREDEDPAVYDQEIHDQKIEQFKKDSTGGLRDFFTRANLAEHLAFSELSDEDFQTIVVNSRAVRKAVTETTLKSTSAVKS